MWNLIIIKGKGKGRVYIYICIYISWNLLMEFKYSDTKKNKLRKGKGK